jgi:short-subunit dehydrogenase
MGLDIQKIFIFGATSAIAQATARLYAAGGTAFYLVGRDADKLDAVADDLTARGAASVRCAVCAAADFDRHGSLVDEVFNELSRVDLALVAHGTLPDQAACGASFDHLREAFETNALSVVSLLTHLANRFEIQGHGTIGAISSVAGDRGRQSNYAYGAAKGAVTVFLQGLRNRLHRSGVHVLTVKPGFVDTPMTARFDKGPLWVSPEAVARGIHHAVARKRHVVYLPWFWRPIMRVLREIPEAVFKRMRL